MLSTAQATHASLRPPAPQRPPCTHPTATPVQVDFVVRVLPGGLDHDLRKLVAPVDLGGQVGAARHEGVAKLGRPLKGHHHLRTCVCVSCAWCFVRCFVRCFVSGAVEAEGAGGKVCVCWVSRSGELPKLSIPRPPPKGRHRTSAFSAISESWVWPHSGERSSAAIAEEPSHQREVRGGAVMQCTEHTPPSRFLAPPTTHQWCAL